MPMDRSSIALHVVGDVDDEIITPVSDDGWAWDGTIECHAGGSLVSVWAAIMLFGGEPYLDRVACAGDRSVVIRPKIVFPPTLA